MPGRRSQLYGPIACRGDTLAIYNLFILTFTPPWERPARKFSLYVGGTSAIARGLRNLCLEPFARAGSRVCTSGGRPQLYKGSAFCASGRPRGPVYEAFPQGLVCEGSSARACPRGRVHRGPRPWGPAHEGLSAKPCARGYVHEDPSASRLCVRETPPFVC